MQGIPSWLPSSSRVFPHLVTTICPRRDALFSFADSKDRIRLTPTTTKKKNSQRWSKTIFKNFKKEHGIDDFGRLATSANAFSSAPSTPTRAVGSKRGRSKKKNAATNSSPAASNVNHNADDQDDDSDIDEDHDGASAKKRKVAAVKAAESLSLSSPATGAAGTTTSRTIKAEQNSEDELLIMSDFPPAKKAGGRKVNKTAPKKLKKEDADDHANKNGNGKGAATAIEAIGLM